MVLAIFKSTNEKDAFVDVNIKWLLVLGKQTFMLICNFPRRPVETTSSFSERPSGYKDGAVCGKFSGSLCLSIE